jgi:hypothetical protein
VRPTGVSPGRQRRTARAASPLSTYGPPPSRHGSAIEIERKFLVAEPPSDLARWPATKIEQGYLAVADDGTEVRVRGQIAAAAAITGFAP